MGREVFNSRRRGLVEHRGPGVWIYNEIVEQKTAKLTTVVVNCPASFFLLNFCHRGARHGAWGL